MTIGSRIFIVGGAGVFIGMSIALWVTFGEDVYAGYVSGVLMNCF